MGCLFYMNLPLASCPSCSSSCAESPAQLNDIRIVLSNTSHPGNIGAVARAMKTMGFSQLTLIAPKKFPHEEAIARAAGASDILEQATLCASLGEALVGTSLAIAVSARQRNLGPEPCSSKELAPVVFEHLSQSTDHQIALVFGNESAGLSNDDVRRCQRTVFIASNPDFSSLNLGAAVQLLCYELRLAAFNNQPPLISRTVPFASALAKNEEVERFYAHLEKIMIATEFFDPARPKRLLPKLRRLFGRTALECDEVSILRGILASIEKNLKQVEK